MKKRVLSAFLSLCMMLTLAPAAFAAETESGITSQDALKTALSTAGSTSDTSGKVVTLDGDITVTNTGVAANSAVITVPAGVTLDGNGHKISVGDGWTGDTKTHILSVEGANEGTTTTIKNLTIIGTNATKSGIHAYNCTGDVKLDTVTIQNCGNAAIQVNGAHVTATNLNTSGNAWGAVNVDQGTNVTVAPSFTLESGTLSESNKIWTEMATSASGDTTSVATITVPDSWATAMKSYNGMTYYADTAAVMIGENPYASLRDAALAATSGDTITLNADVTVTNKGILSGDVNSAVITLPDGATLDGKGHTISAAADWEKTSDSKIKNHILGVTAATTTGVTIQNVTIVGNESTKHGINAWTATTTENSTAGKVMLSDVTIQNCGAAGMVVQNTEVTADKLKTSGNAWGGINVDNAGNPKLTLSNPSIVEPVQVWTELTNVLEGTITIDNEDFIPVAGEGSSTDSTGLKGFIYYTTDPAKLGEASIEKDGKITVYSTLENALEKSAAEDTITLLKDVQVEDAISIAKSLTINGNQKTITYAPSTTAGDAKDKANFITVTASNVTIQDATIDAEGAKNAVHFYLVTGGMLDSVTVKGGAYTSVLVNGSAVTVKDSVMNPNTDAHANIEYGMGSGVKQIPNITLDNVSGDTKMPLVYVDNDTLNAVKTNTDSLTENSSSKDVIDVINKTLIGTQLTVDDEGNIVAPQTYTITFDANGHDITTIPAATTTNNEGKLAPLPPLEKDGRYTFAGWYTAASGGEKVTTDTVFTKDTTLYAHWNYSSGGGGGGGVTTYAVTTNSPANGTVTVSSKSAAKDATVTITVAPASGYQLDKLTVADKDGKGVALTDKGNGRYTFTMPASKVEVTATFKQAPVTHVCPAEKYTDVDTTQWYHEGVDYVIEKGMMNGTGTNTFEPNATTTRGMIVTILYRLEKEPAAGTSPFTDVDANQWYAKAVAWAAANGVVNGTSSTTFNPNDPITREQMAAILYRYATFKGYDVTQKADLASYTDASQISAYAKDAMSWANKAGLIGGVSATTLQPQGSAIRAQVAAILMRFCENVVK